MTSKSNAWMQNKAEEVSSLQEKLREATRTASALRSEKRSLMEATDLLQSTNNQLKANLGASRHSLEISVQAIPGWLMICHVFGLLVMFCGRVTAQCTGVRVKVILMLLMSDGVQISSNKVL